MVRASPSRPADAERLVADRRRARRERPRRRDEVVEAVVDDAQPPVRRAARPRSCRNQGCCSGLVREHVLEDARALAALLRGRAARARRRPTSGTSRRSCGRRRAARRRGRRGSASNSAKSGASQAGSSRRPCAPSARAVVLMRVDVARAARADVDREAAAGRLGDHAGAPHLEGERADAAGPLRSSTRGEVAGGVLDGMDERVVAEVRPAVVHVQDGDVDRRARPRAAGRPGARRARSRRRCAARSVGQSCRQYSLPYVRLSWQV